MKKRNHLSTGLIFIGICIALGVGLFLVTRPSQPVNTEVEQAVDAASTNSDGELLVADEATSSTETGPIPDPLKEFCDPQYQGEDAYYRPPDGNVYFTGPGGICKAAPTASSPDDVANELTEQGFTITEHADDSGTSGE